MMKKIALITLSCLQLCANDLTWGTPTVLSTLGVDASDPRVGMDASGNIVAAWIENDKVLATTQLFEGSWGTATQVSDSGASSLELVVDPAGNATAIWSLSGVIQSASLPFGGTWGMPVNLSGAGSSLPQIAVNSGGDLAAIWISSDEIQAATQPFGMSWSSAATISDAMVTSDSPQIVINDNQLIVGVWHGVFNGLDVIYSSTTTLGSDWPTFPSIISDFAFSSVQPHVTIDSENNPFAAWYRFKVSGTDYFDVVVQAAFGHVDGSWDAPADCSAAGMRNPSDLVISVALNQNDMPFVLWTNGYDSSTLSLQGRLFLDEAWTDVISFMDQNIYLLDQNMLISSANYAYAAFMAYDSGTMTPVIKSFKENTYNKIPNFGNILTVSTSGNNAFPRISGTLVDSAHTVATVWLHDNGSNNVIQASVASGVAIDTPSSLMVTQDSNDLGVFTEYFNTLTWSSMSPDSSSHWVIFRNNVWLLELPVDTLTFVDHNAVQNEPVTYGVALQTIDGDLSPISTVSFP